MRKRQHARSGSRAAVQACAILLATIGTAFASAQATEEAGSEAAPDSGTLLVELNRLDPVENTCKASLVISNQTETGFESLALDLVIFDNDGIIAGRMAVELAPLPSSKTSVRAFSLEIGRASGRAGTTGAV